ncbi:hypothetical protein FH972_026876 [Carpinus fangiana]|uniref:Uncharacterized protein n=1 Tax=Carpinus fangiana TaxID=176857 RepID=A0A5N6L640_9ROSI|nr:hypothetical protein FH972_026876 [Carpinus fangiana]
MDRRAPGGTMVTHPHLVQSPYYPPALPSPPQHVAAREADHRRSATDSALRPRGSGVRSSSRSHSQSEGARLPQSPHVARPAFTSPRPAVSPALVSPASTLSSPGIDSQHFTPHPAGQRRGSALERGYGSSASSRSTPYTGTGSFESPNSYGSFDSSQTHHFQGCDPTPPQSRKASDGESLNSRNSKPSHEIGRKIKSAFKDMFKRDLDDHDGGERIQRPSHWSEEY